MGLPQPEQTFRNLLVARRLVAEEAVAREGPAHASRAVVTVAVYDAPRERARRRAGRPC